MKANKSTTIKRKSLKKGTVIEEEIIDMVDIWEGDKDIDSTITKKKREEVLDDRRTKSSPTKS